MTAAGLVIVVGALLFFCTTIAYTFGAWRGTADLDENFEIAKALGAYGAYLRMEAEALGVTVEELAERDAPLVSLRAHRLVETHRLAWELTHGPIPAGLVVRHACDNPPCCEPTHLSLGTHQDNSDDKVSRGRQARGPALPHARLSETQVREIRARYTRLKSPPGERGYRSNARDLASEFGVSVGHVRCIVAGTERSNV